MVRNLYNKGRLVSEPKGEIEKYGKVLVICRIHVTYHIKLKPQQHKKAQKVHRFHADLCPAAHTIKGSIEVTTESRMEEV